MKQIQATALMAGACLDIYCSTTKAEVDSLLSLALTGCLIGSFALAHECRHVLGDRRYLGWFLLFVALGEVNAWTAWDTPNGLGPIGSVIARIAIPLGMFTLIWLHSVQPIWERNGVNLGDCGLPPKTA